MIMKTTNKELKRRAIQRTLVIATAAMTCLGVSANEHEKDKSAKAKAAYGENAAHHDPAQTFIKEALMGGEMEMKMAQLGQQRAQNAEVKRLAERLAQDHQQSNNELKQIASKKGGDQTTHEVKADDPKHAKAKEKFAKLESSSGAEFDKEFTKCAIKHHNKTIAKFETAAREVTDADLKSFVDKTLPKLREHLTMAKSAATAIGLNLATIETEASESEASGAPAAGQSGTLNPADDVDKSNENKARESKDLDQSSNYSIESTPSAAGGPASTESSSSSSIDTSIQPDQGENKDQSLAPQASIEANTGFDAATRTDSSLTVNQNTPAADVDASASVDVDVDTDKGDGKTLGVETRDDDGKILGIEKQPDDGRTLGLETREGDGKTLGVQTQEGDGKVLGLNTSKSDRRLLGIIPWGGKKDRDAGADAEVQVGDSSARVEADVDASGGPATTVSGSSSSTVSSGASATVQFNQLPEPVKSQIRAQGGNNTTTVRKMTVYEVEVNGKKMLVKEDGTPADSTHSSVK